MEQKLGPLQALARFWGTLNNTQKFVSAAFLSVSIVLLGIVSVVASKPKMEVLFSGLQSNDAGAIIAKLQEQKVPYEVDGTVIKVPTKNVYETRMQLASQGLPAGGNVGFELFDKNSFGMTEFSQKVTYQRALQGELERTISQINGVDQARVSMAVPEKSVFTENQTETTASVLLKLKPGMELSADQVGGVVHLVSSAVEGLKANQVTVVDTNGNLLSEAGDDGTGLDARMSSTKLKLKRQVEQQIAKDIDTMLARVLGPNKAVVRVNAKMNFDRRETSSETFSPGGANTGVLTSEQKTQESYGNGNAGAVAPAATGGPAGIASTLPGAQANTASGGKNNYLRTESTAKYEVSKTTERVVKAPGEIEELSVAVMVDGKVDAATLPAIKNTVSAACGIGLDPARKDRIVVESVQFDTSATQGQEKEMAALAAKAMYMSVGKTVGAILLLFIFLFFLKTILKQVNISIPVPQQPVLVQDYGISAPSQMQSQPQQRPVVEEIMETATPVPTIGEVPPEEVAQVLRKWMSES